MTPERSSVHLVHNHPGPFIVQCFVNDCRSLQKADDFLIRKSAYIGQGEIAPPAAAHVAPHRVLALAIHNGAPEIKERTSARLKTWKMTDPVCKALEAVCTDRRRMTYSTYPGHTFSRWVGSPFVPLLDPFKPPNVPTKMVEQFQKLEQFGVRLDNYNFKDSYPSLGQRHRADNKLLARKIYIWLRDLDKSQFLDFCRQTTTRFETELSPAKEKPTKRTEMPLERYKSFETIFESEGSPFDRFSRVQGSDSDTCSEAFRTWWRAERQLVKPGAGTAGDRWYSPRWPRFYVIEEYIT
jgi:hypothetical protein